ARRRRRRRFVLRSSRAGLRQRGRAEHGEQQQQHRRVSDQQRHWILHLISKELRSQSLMVVSPTGSVMEPPPPLARILPSGENATDSMRPLLPVKTDLGSHVFVSQRVMV